MPLVFGIEFPGGVRFSFFQAAFKKAEAERRDDCAAIAPTLPAAELEDRTIDGWRLSLLLKVRHECMSTSWSGMKLAIDATGDGVDEANIVDTMGTSSSEKVSRIN